MKKPLIIIGALVLAFTGSYIYGADRAERNARLINFKNDLKDAQLRLRDGDGLTNRYRHTRVYSFTHAFAIGGTNYYCELAGTSGLLIAGRLQSLPTNYSFGLVERQERCHEFIFLA